MTADQQKAVNTLIERLAKERHINAKATVEENYTVQPGDRGYTPGSADVGVTLDLEEFPHYAVGRDGGITMTNVSTFDEIPGRTAMDACVYGDLYLDKQNKRGRGTIVYGGQGRHSSWDAAPTPRAKTIQIKWVRSAICSPVKHKVVIKGLGFTRLYQVIERPDTAAIRGMVRKVPHLVEIVK